MLFEAGLVDKILAEIQGQAGCLPLLQYTLNLLWEKERKANSIKDRTLKIATYDKLGGVRGALQQHVDRIYQKLSAPEQQATQRIFLKLVDIGENAETGIQWKPVRRRAQLSEFGEDEREVLLKLVNRSLLVSDDDLSATATNSSKKSPQFNPTIEIAHEILLTSWDKLHRWIKENRQGIALRNRLYEDVRRWQDKKPEDELWAGSKLEQVLELKQDDNFNRVLGGFDAEAEQFIDASVGVRDRELRRARRRTIIAYAFAGLATIANGFAFVQWQQSALNYDAAKVKNLLPLEPVNALVLAIKSTGESQERMRRVLPQVQSSLYDAIGLARERDFFEGHEDGVRSVAFSDDGKHIVSGSGDRTVRLWDLEGNPIGEPFEGHESVVSSVAFSNDGKYIVSGSWDSTVRSWDLEGNSIGEPFKGHEDPVISVAFSDDGKYIVSGSWDSTVRLWDQRATPSANPLKGMKILSAQSPLAMMANTLSVVVGTVRCGCGAVVTGKIGWKWDAIDYVPIQY